MFSAFQWSQSWHWQSSLNLYCRHVFSSPLKILHYADMFSALHWSSSWHWQSSLNLYCQHVLSSPLKILHYADMFSALHWSSSWHWQSSLNLYCQHVLSSPLKILHYADMFSALHWISSWHWQSSLNLYCQHVLSSPLKILHYADMFSALHWISSWHWQSSLNLYCRHVLSSPLKLKLTLAVVTEPVLPTCSQLSTEAQADTGSRPSLPCCRLPQTPTSAVHWRTPLSLSRGPDRLIRHCRRTVWSDQLLWEQTDFDFTVRQCLVPDENTCYPYQTQQERS